MSEGPAATSKRKAVELHPEVEDIDPEQYESFKQLKALDDQLESTMQRHLRRLDMYAQAAPKLIRKTLAVSFYYSFDPTKGAKPDVKSTTTDNLSSPQPSASSSTSQDEVEGLTDVGEWTFRVEGTVMDGQHPWPTSKRFSHFIRKAVVDLDEHLFPTNNQVEWSSFRSGEDSDGFEITRPGKKGVATHSLRLQLVRNHAPERFTMAPDLFAAIGGYIQPNYGLEDGFTKADISLALWAYIKEKDLMQTDDCRVIDNDETFQAIFGCASMPIHAAMGKLQTKLTPVAPLILNFTLKLDDTAPMTEVRLDVKHLSVEVQADEELVRVQRTCFADIAAHAKTVAQESDLLEQQMADIAHRIQGHVDTRMWMRHFCADPAAFMEKVVASQESDTQIVTLSTTEKTTVGAHKHNPSLYGQPWVHSTIDMILNRDA
ncbi:Aste57867_11048 [Aphanomyces stellatus]|uniref:Aste57867_11048 protein n=1 Tax=Aphanomyces stellatus TaxID=120398 RepID=A0A485KSM2_9STRA|nr:hypothetical protein As57867_011006 [Aphanomyces stellatus]VFT87916.1 Aste57867_11048 [Aphanomyces stellatus]